MKNTILLASISAALNFGAAHASDDTIQDDVKINHLIPKLDKDSLVSYANTNKANRELFLAFNDQNKIYKTVKFYIPSSFEVKKAFGMDGSAPKQITIQNKIWEVVAGSPSTQNTSEGFKNIAIAAINVGSGDVVSCLYSGSTSVTIERYVVKQNFKLKLENYKTLNPSLKNTSSLSLFLNMFSIFINTNDPQFEPDTKITEEITFICEQNPTKEETTKSDQKNT